MTHLLPFPIEMMQKTIRANEGAGAMVEDDGHALLVTEIHHRVMNSYQIISALARRCGRIRNIDELRPFLDDLADRLTAFAAVHRQLAIPPSGCFADYCLALGGNLIAAFGRFDTIHVGVDAVDLPHERLAQIALIVAELLTNCLKHSLGPTAPGSIYLDLRNLGDRLVIEAWDSAAGPVPSPAPKPSRVVSALSANLGGDACIVDRQGYCARVTLPVSNPGANAAGRGRNTKLARSLPAAYITASRMPVREMANGHP